MDAPFLSPQTDRHLRVVPTTSKTLRACRRISPVRLFRERDADRMMRAVRRFGLVLRCLVPFAAGDVPVRTSPETKQIQLMREMSAPRSLCGSLRKVRRR